MESGLITHKNLIPLFTNPYHLLKQEHTCFSSIQRGKFNGVDELGQAKECPQRTRTNSSDIKNWNPNLPSKIKDPIIPSAIMHVTGCRINPTPVMKESEINMAFKSGMLLSFRELKTSFKTVGLCRWKSGGGERDGE